MKAEVAQQRSLLEVAELDAELSKMDHRAGHLPERTTASGYKPTRSPLATDSGHCRLRWKTWTLRSRASSRRSTR